MVVAHPDDESLFGGAALLQENGWKVVCVSNFRNTVRRKEFMEAMLLAGCRYEIWDYTDEIMTPFDADTLRNDLTRVLAELPWKRVVSHNQQGEYGHPHHIQIHKLMLDLVGEDLWVFGQGDDPLSESMWWQKNDLVGCYYSRKSDCYEHMQNGRFEAIIKHTTFLEKLA